MQAIPSEFLAIDRKERAKIPFVDVAIRDARERICDYEDVVIPLSEEEARVEAARCIHCPDPAPCMLACPVHNDIPSAMWLIEQGQFLEAAKLYRQNQLSARDLRARLPARAALPGFVRAQSKS